MKNEDKEAFDKWHYENISNPPTINDLISKAWSDACEYKQKDIDDLLAENAKLRECVEFYAHGYATEIDDSSNAYFDNGHIRLSSGKRARQVLKELEDK